MAFRAAGQFYCSTHGFTSASLQLGASILSRGTPVEAFKIWMIAVGRYALPLPQCLPRRFLERFANRLKEPPALSIALCIRVHAPGWALCSAFILRNSIAAAAIDPQPLYGFIKVRQILRLCFVDAADKRIC